ncbi:hypothetical protein AXF42_Ash001910 [Apostasia shenzhenica]|uniref:RNase III domain-containing protein n=1 Tax=Apostasia shenzhenica TaxID=1088818 RepID=A0A2I0ABK8_9ASPA|nr:hypothetical protein AXF42_Ash001910 [Apostasia shenzhenica]
MPTLLRLLLSFSFSVVALPQLQAAASSILQASSSFSAGIDTLQNQIGYHFQSVDLLRRAMTHSSFSRDNNRALSLLGLSAMEATAAFSLLRDDPEASAAAVNGRIAEIAGFETCSAAGNRLGIEKLVRVASGTTASPAIVCGALRAMFGAISVDAGGIDAVGKVVLRVVGSGLLLAG